MFVLFKVAYVELSSKDNSISERLSDELQPLLEAEKEKAKDSATPNSLKSIF